MEAIFTEEQRLIRSHSWLWPILVLPVVLSWWGFVQQILLHRPFGNNPGPDWMMWVLLVVCGIVFPIFFWTVTMRVRVDTDEVRISYTPLFTRRIAIREILNCAACGYRPLWDYGGWGIRWSSGKGWVYSVSGNKGVSLELAGGRRLVIGSREPEPLAAAIQSVMSAVRRRSPARAGGGGGI